MTDDMINAVLGEHAAVIICLSGLILSSAISLLRLLLVMDREEDDA